MYIDPEKVKLNKKEQSEAKDWRIKKCGQDNFNALKKRFEYEQNEKRGRRERTPNTHTTKDIRNKTKN